MSSMRPHHSQIEECNAYDAEEAVKEEARLAAIQAEQAKAAQQDEGKKQSKSKAPKDE